MFLNSPKVVVARWKMEACIGFWRSWRRSCFSRESTNIISLCHYHHRIRKAKRKISSHLSGGSFTFASFLKGIVALWFLVSAMATKIKGIYKSFKYISQIFVVKEREMEIGYPTDVKHVAHIGWDGPSGSAPSWMNEFKSGPDFTTASLGNSRDSNSTAVSSWPPQDDFEQPSTEVFRGISSTDLPTIPKKPRRKKKSTNSPKSSSTSRSSRAAKAKAATYTQVETGADLQM